MSPLENCISRKLEIDNDDKEFIRSVNRSLFLPLNNRVSEIIRNHD